MARGKTRPTSESCLASATNVAFAALASAVMLFPSDLFFYAHEDCLAVGTVRGSVCAQLCASHVVVVASCAPCCRSGVVPRGAMEGPVGSARVIVISESISFFFFFLVSTLCKFETRETVCFEIQTLKF